MEFLDIVLRPIPEFLNRLIEIQTICASAQLVRLVRPMDCLMFRYANMVRVFAYKNLAFEMHTKVIVPYRLTDSIKFSSLLFGRPDSSHSRRRYFTAREIQTSALHRCSTGKKFLLQFFFSKTKFFYCRKWVQLFAQEHEFKLIWQ